MVLPHSCYSCVESGTVLEEKRCPDPTVHSEGFLLQSFPPQACPFGANWRERASRLSTCLQSVIVVRRTGEIEIGGHSCFRFPRSTVCAVLSCVVLFCDALFTLCSCVR